MNICYYHQDLHRRPLRSGLAAGRAVASGDLEAYERFVVDELEPEQRAGARLLRIFERTPAPFHLLLATTGRGARFFVRFCRGERSLARPRARPEGVGLR